MKLLVATAFVSLISFGVLGATNVMAGGATAGRPGVNVVAPQITRELATQTGKQVSDAASQASSNAQTR